MCAYTQKVIKFCNMMKSLGHEVILYAGDKNEANVDELVTVAKHPLPPEKYTEMPFDVNNEAWVEMNKNTILAMNKRLKPRDFICVIAGVCQQPIHNAFGGDYMVVEFGIGYAGVFAPYKVFESYSWMHTVYGKEGADTKDGNFYDAVISNYFDLKDFPYVDKKDDYFLYIGRLIDRKGWRIAQEVCKKLGKRLIVAGPGKFDGYGEYVGPVNAKRRAELMGKARAVFVPTLYIEPFGGVMVEANLCGTPVITTDWGAFTDNVTNGRNGFRCRTFKQFCQAAQDIDTIQPSNCRAAGKAFDMDHIRYLYQDYFSQLMTLWENGWYS